jgi:hypothetical protein
MMNEFINYLEDATWEEKIICLAAMFLGIVFFITVFIDIMIVFQD